MSGREHMVIYDRIQAIFKRRPRKIAKSQY